MTMEVWSHSYTGADGTVYQVTEIFGMTAEMELELRKVTTYRAHINRAQNTGTAVLLPHSVSGTGENVTYTPITRASWDVIVKAKEDADAAAAKAQRIADRRAARKAAAQALTQAVATGKLMLDPKTDAILISPTVVSNLEAGALTSEGEPA